MSMNAGMLNHIPPSLREFSVALGTGDMEAAAADGDPALEALILGRARYRRGAADLHGNSGSGRTTPGFAPKPQRSGNGADRVVAHRVPKSWPISSEFGPPHL